MQNDSAEPTDILKHILLNSFLSKEKCALSVLVVALCNLRSEPEP